MMYITPVQAKSNTNTSKNVIVASKSHSLTRTFSTHCNDKPQWDIAHCCSHLEVITRRLRLLQCRSSHHIKRSLAVECDLRCREKVKFVSKQGSDLPWERRLVLTWLAMFSTAEGAASHQLYKYQRSIPLNKHQDNVGRYCKEQYDKRLKDVKDKRLQKCLTAFQMWNKYKYHNLPYYGHRPVLASGDRSPRWEFLLVFSTRSFTTGVHIP